MNFRNMSKNDKVKFLIYSIISVVIISIIAIITVKYAPIITEKIGGVDSDSLNEFRDYLLGFKGRSVLVYTMFQIIQVVIAVIPGEPVQIAGGYVFGTVLGTIYSTIGMLIGSVIAFYLARLIGMPLVKFIMPEKQRLKFDFLLNSKKGEMVLFILFLIPGIPKDVLLYVSGVSPVNPLNFFIIYIIARLPGNLGSAYIGANLQKENYAVSIIVTAIAAVLFLLGIIFKDKIIATLNKLVHRE